MLRIINKLKIMAGEGSMLHAIHTMRNNKALLKDKRRNNWKNYTGNKIILTEDPIKASPELLASIREKFRKERKQNFRENIYYIFLTVIILTLLFYTIYNMEWVGIKMKTY